MKNIILSLLVVCLLLGVIFFSMNPQKRDDFFRYVDSIGSTIISKETQNKNRIVWLKFTINGYEEEKKVVLKHFKDVIKKIESGEYGSTGLYIAISKEDINKDGNKEIIALLFHNYFSTATTNASLGIYTKMNGRYCRIPLPPVFADVEEIENQRQIGIKMNGQNKWEDFIVENDVWTWSEGRYMCKEKNRFMPKPFYN